MIVTCGHLFTNKRCFTYGNIFIYSRPTSLL